MPTITSKNTEVAVQYLTGVGQKRAEALQSAGVHVVRDLLYYFPRRYLDRSTVAPIRQLKPNQIATVIGKVAAKGIQKGKGKGRSRFVLQLTDKTGVITCVWFHQVQYWNKIFEIGDTLAVSGKIGYFAGLQIVHPEYDRISDDTEDVSSQFVNTGMIIPLYSSSEQLKRVGLDSRGFRRIIRPALEKYGHIMPEILPASLLERLKLPHLREALWQIHYPESQAKLHAARNRFKFEELFYLELVLAYRKNQYGVQQDGIAFEEVGDRTRRLSEILPFELTDAQKRVLHEIRADMKRPKPMLRLLQGDVGSGKTIVSLITMLIAVENGYQAALMAPTEILAEQHYLSTHQPLEQMGINVRLLLGGQRAATRRESLQSIADGSCHIAIGTHALIQSNVEFNRLGLVVIDEQHRFGVLQRAALMEKGITPDVLVMTATPIPRTLSLTLYGDLDVSIIDQLPRGRKPIVTSWRYAEKRSQIYQFVKSHIKQGRQAYIVFPLVEESEKMDLQAATESYQRMSETDFRNCRIALLHGRMTSNEKESIMAAFKRGEIDILVSTTVIEVGVDVPNATIMVIEHAERFGLTQLHQLRGRVGRGDEQSYCILIAHRPVSDEGLVRLNTMAKTTDGFKISEVDLKLRGPGEFFGTRQSGMPELKIANPIDDFGILEKARQEAFALVKNDPQLLDPEHKAVHEHFKQHYLKKLQFIRMG